MSKTKRESGCLAGPNNPSTPLTNKDVLEIMELKDSGIPRKIIAEKYNVTSATISNIWLGKTWSFITGVVYKKQN